jgi:quercetin dioxygenase-like cupin family protein
MSERYGVATLDELATAPIPGQARWHTIRRTFGVSSFGVNAWTATEDGGQIIGEHEEASGQAHEELYVVVSGRATFTLDGEEVDAPAGTLVHVADPAVKRGATGEEGTTILVVGAKPGEAFTPSTWERSAEALGFWPTEEWDRAIEVLEGHLVDTPGSRGDALQPRLRARAGRSSGRGPRACAQGDRVPGELRRVRREGRGPRLDPRPALTPARSRHRTGTDTARFPCDRSGRGPRAPLGGRWTESVARRPGADRTARIAEAPSTLTSAAPRFGTGHSSLADPTEEELPWTRP